MPVTEFPSLADQVRNLPAEGAGRSRQLNHLIDLQAAAEAAAALHNAASRKRDDSGVLAQALKAADAILAGDEAAARDYLSAAVTNRELLALVPDWVRELRQAASSRPETGACTVATALAMWAWTANHLRDTQHAVDELAEAICPLLAARSLALDVTPGNSPDVQLRTDLSQIYAARVAAATGARCAELVFGYRRHLKWDAEGCATCFRADELDELEALMPGFASGAGTTVDVIGEDGTHPAKAGPCAGFEGLDRFMKLRNRLDACLTGARASRDRVASVMSEVRVR